MGQGEIPMDKKKFCYSLRLEIEADQYSEDRIKNVVKYSKKYGYDDVMFFTNNSMAQISHITIDEVRPQVEIIKKAKPLLNAAGISVSLNPGCTVGQGDKSEKMRGLHPDFTLMMDVDGYSNGSTACPLCKNFQKYLADLYAYYTVEIDPEIIWIEDDFRLHNHGSLNWGGCFCDLHMKRYCEKLGFEVSREEFVAQILKEGQGKSIYRDAYAEVARETMVELAKAVGDRVREVSGGKTVVGLMSSHPEEHAIEYRDWYGILYGLSDVPADRLNLPTYSQISPMSYGWLFNKVVTQVRARIPNETWILPELENSEHGPQAKSAKNTAFMIESTLPVIPHGCTLNMYDYGNGIIPQWRLGEECQKLKPYMQAFMDLGIDFQDMDGVYIPFNDESVKTLHPTNYFNALDHLKPDDAFFAAYLSSLGVAYKYVGNFDDVKGKIIAISGQWLRNFDAAYIRRLFRDNAIILNADSLNVLMEMGLGDLAGVESCAYDIPRDGDVRYELAVDDVYGIPGYRKNARRALLVQYRKDAQIRVYSKLYNAYHQEVGFGTVKSGNVLIVPHKGEYRVQRHIDMMQQSMAFRFFEDVNDVAKPIRVQEYCVSPYYYADAKTLVLVNFCDDDWYKLNLTMPGNLCFSSVRYLKRNGQWADCKFTRQGDKVTVNARLGGTKTLVLQFLE